MTNNTNTTNTLADVFKTEKLTNKIEIPKSITKSIYSIVNDNVIMYIGKTKAGEDKYRKLPIRHVGPDGILCSDNKDTFLTWDKFQ